ncbi:MAG: arylamine N-acetyltransferase [Fidelibacterota bacterium]
MKLSIPDNQFHSAVERFLSIAGIEHREPDLDNLRKILHRFARLPYENLSKIIKLNRHWETNHFRFPEEVIEDHERHRLGGTCFSLTFYLKTILDYMGYQTDFLMADMRSGTNTHCALLLNHNRHEFLVDPGYLLFEPLEISGAVRYPERLLARETDTDRFSLWTLNGRQLKKRYTFTKTATIIEQFFTNWENSFHLMTMHGICLSKRDESGFVYLHNHYIKREGDDLIYKGKFSEDIAVVACRYFDIPAEIVQKAERALQANLQYDKELGFRVPRWVK